MSVLRREQKYLVAAVQTDAVHNWGSKLLTYGAADRAAVVANRLSRTTQRTGSFRSRTNGDGRGSSTAGGGFGPRRPVVVGAGIAFRGPKVIRTRSRRLSDWQRQGTSTLLKPIVVNPAAATFVARPTAVHLAYSKRGKAKSSLPRMLVVASPTPPFDPIKTTLAPSPRGGRRNVYDLAPPVVVTPDSYTPCAFVTDNFTRANEDPIAGIWETTPPPFGNNGARIVSNRFVGNGLGSDGVSQLRQAINATAPWQMQVTTEFSPVANQMTMGLVSNGEGDVQLSIQPTQITIFTASEIAAGSFDSAFALRQWNDGDEFALEVTPDTVTDIAAYRVLVKPPGGAWQTILLVYDFEPFDWNNGKVYQPFLQVIDTAISSFSICPYTNDGVAPQRATQSRGVPRSRLSPPAVVTPISTFVARPALVTLAPSARGKVVYQLGANIVVFVEPQVFSGPPPTLTPSTRGRPKSRLAPPAVVTPAVVAAFFGPKVTLADSRRGKPKSLLRAPARPRDPISAVISGFLAPLRNTVPATQSVLRPPIIPLAAAAFTGPQIQLVRIRPVETLTFLRPPTIIGGSIAYGGPRVRLTNPLDRVPATMSRLRPPTVVSAQTFTGPQITLASSRRGAPKSILHAPTVVAPVLARPALVHLVRIRPVRTLAILRQPVVVTPRVPQDATLDITLAYSVRGKAKSRLRPPAVVAPVLARAILVHLAPSSRGVPQSRLSAPVVVAPFFVRPTETTLVRITPPRTHPFLRAPVVVRAGAPARPALVSLAPSSRGTAKSKLSAPATVAVVVALARPTDITLAYSLRGKPKSTLRPPAVVAPVLAPPIATALAPQKRGTPKSRLTPPTVVFPFFAQPTSITLVRIRPVATRSFLGAPTDLVDTQDLGEVRVTLAPQKRGAPKSRLSPPAVVGPVLARPVLAKLVRIRPVATRWELKPPTVVFLAVELSGPEVTLVRIRPPRTIARLFPPVAGAAQLKAETTLSVTLTYSRRGKPKSILRAPRVIDLRPQTRFLAVTLAPSRRPIAKSKLARVIVPRFVAPRPVEVTLTRIRPRRTTVLYTGVVYGGRVHAPITITLAASSRLARAPLSRLFEPVRPPDQHARPTLVTLAPQARRPGEAVLSPPAVVGAAERFFGPTVVLAPSSRGRTIVVRIQPDSGTQPCYGVATGSTAPSAENALETEAGATTTSTIAAAAETASSTAAASTIEGTTAPGAENDISDAQREGC